MPKRCSNEEGFSSEICNKKKCAEVPEDFEIKNGECIKDIFGNEWKIGKQIGCGGFGIIYTISPKHGTNFEKKEYVVKFEKHSSGPLFVEINCYLRIGKYEMIEEWKQNNCVTFLGMPSITSYGSHNHKGVKFRFLIIEKYEKDLESIFKEKKTFNLKTVLQISKEILKVLEYIHSKGYIHCDIKAANILLKFGCSQKSPNENSSKQLVKQFSKLDIKIRSPKPRKVKQIGKSVERARCNLRKILPVCYNEDTLEKSFIWNAIPKKDKNDQIYLVDFGLATKYKLSNGEFRQYEDERKAHAGTLLFCSRDAHKGVQSTRSDLESLAYNMVYWLSGSLPWINDLEEPDMVERKKQNCFRDTTGFLCFCFVEPPKVLKFLFEYIKTLGVKDKPDYNTCRKFIDKAFTEQGYSDDHKFDFGNFESWGLECLDKKSRDPFKRPPLISNVQVKKTLLRKEVKTESAAAALNWSKMLSNPEVILKQSKRKKSSDVSALSLDNLDLESLNPTQAMRDVYQKYEERIGLSPRSDYEPGYPEGYTPAMQVLWQKIKEKKYWEKAVNSVNKKRNVKVRKVTEKKTGKIFSPKVTRRRVKVSLRG